MNGVCDWCHENPIDDRFREVSGIEQRRAQGGANKIIGRKETGRRICAPCVSKIERGIPINQGTLL
jgi:hypothetical protein